MIRTITGTVIALEPHAVVVNVGGVGYLLHTNAPSSTLIIGNDATLYTHLAVRENALDLYGFLDRDTLDVFELLITLPKIGPKSALQILTQADITLLKQAVANEDATYLSKMSGIGKKSAEKIVAGLKEKFEVAYDPTIDTAPSGTEASVSYARDTIDALVALGYSTEEARRVVRTLSVERPDISNSAEALKEALSRLSN